MNRRSALAAGGAMLSTALAGCSLSGYLNGAVALYVVNATEATTSASIRAYEDQETPVYDEEVSLEFGEGRLIEDAFGSGTYMVDVTTDEYTEEYRFTMGNCSDQKLAIRVEPKRATFSKNVC